MLGSNKQKPLVSILIDNYNYGLFLKQAIDSALNQTYPRIEVIVVDDGSTDDSREIIESYGERIVSVLKMNGGQASAFNAGYAVCKGEIICLLDADDLFLPEKVFEVVKLFQLSDDVDWVFTESAPIKTEKLSSGNFDLLYADIRVMGSQELPKKVDFRTNLRNGKLSDFAPSTSNLCFTKRILEKIFPLPEIKGLSGMAVTDLYMKLLSIGLSTGFVSVQNLGIYRMHGNQYATLNLSKKRRMYGEIYVTCGYWIRTNFPEFSKISMKIIAKGFAHYLRSNYMKGQKSDADCDEMVRSYLGKINFTEKLKAYFMIFYYFIKLQYKSFV